MRSRDTFVPRVIVIAVLSLAGSMAAQVPESQRVYKTLNKSGRGWSDNTVGGGYVKPDPNYKVPRTPDGQPDMQGIWHAATMGAQLDGSLEEQPGKRVKSRVVDPQDEKVPYQAWARAKVPELDQNWIDPQSNCTPVGLPRFMSYREYAIVQAPGKVSFIAEHLENFRLIALDDRPHVSKNVHFWLGDTRGHWEGNTLVMDTTSINDKTWLSIRGDFHSDQMTLKERLTPIADGVLQYEVTVTDPVVLERPFTMAWPLTRSPKDYTFIEEYCAEGNKSTEGQLDGGRKLFTGIADIRQ